jgi:hypothetical protein
MGDGVLNAALVRRALAQVATFPPTVAPQERLLRRQRETKRGWWG